jgi:hypothetical protein
MAFETKEEYLDRVLCKEKPKCKHCGEEMKLWEIPPMAVGDGLGWGTPFLFVCFNDACPVYSSGWENIRENYGRTASYRCICYPETEQFECIPVFSPFGATGQIVDEQAMNDETAKNEAIKTGFSTLADCYVRKDYQTILLLLLDASLPGRVRLKSAEMIGDIGEPPVIEALKNHTFTNDILREEVEKTIRKIHDRSFTRECPFCAEIILKRAKVCKHCGKEVAGI